MEVSNCQLPPNKTTICNSVTHLNIWLLTNWGRRSDRAATREQPEVPHSPDFLSIQAALTALTAWGARTGKKKNKKKQQLESYSKRHKKEYWINKDRGDKLVKRGKIIKLNISPEPQWIIMVTLDCNSLARPVGIVRILEVIFTCISFSLMASADISHSLLTPFWTWRMFTWCFCFSVTILILLLEFTSLHSKLPISWDDFTTAFAMLATLMVGAIFTAMFCFCFVYAAFSTHTIS